MLKPVHWLFSLAYNFLNYCHLFAGIVIICYVVQVANLPYKDDSREVAVGINKKTSRDQKDSKDSRERKVPREPRELRDNRESREHRESRDQRDDDRERDRGDREEPEEERYIKERKNSKVAKEPKEIKESRDSRDAKDYKGPKEKKETKNPDVDEFLEKILQSDKMRQIADLIAEKAADKILKESKTHNIMRSDVNNKEKDDENKSSEKDKHTNEFDDDEALIKDKVPKIDAKAAMKKVSQFPDDNVNLNYKHFIADSFVTKESSSNIKHRLETLDEARDSAEDNSEKQDKKSFKKTSLRSSPNFRESGETGSGEHKRHEKHSHRPESEQRNENKRVAKHHSLSEEESSESDESVTAKKTEPADNSKEEPDIFIKTKPKGSKPNEPEKSLRKVQEASKPLNNYTEADNSDSDSNKVPIADAHSQVLPSKTIFRKEGEKLLEFASPPDYNDYHEKLSTLLKSVQDKTMRRLEEQSSYKET